MDGTKHILRAMNVTFINKKKLIISTSIIVLVVIFLTIVYMLNTEKLNLTSKNCEFSISYRNEYNRHLEWEYVSNDGQTIICTYYNKKIKKDTTYNSTNKNFAAHTILDDIIRFSDKYSHSYNHYSFPHYHIKYRDKKSKIYVERFIEMDLSHNQNAETNNYNINFAINQILDKLDEKKLWMNNK
jgi:hypothetical protein